MTESTHYYCGKGRLIAAALAALLCIRSAAATAEEPAAKPPARINSQQKTALYGLPGNGSKFVYLLDTSESMTVPKGKPLSSAKEEIIASIDKLDKLSEFYVIHYNNVPKLLEVTGGGRPSFGTDENKLVVKRLIEGIAVGPRTEHEPALIMALRMRPDVIWLMTDGDDPELTGRDLERISRVNEAVSIIHVVQFSKGPPKRGQEWLKRLASENRGEYKLVDVSQAKETK